MKRHTLCLPKVAKPDPYLYEFAKLMLKVKWKRNSKMLRTEHCCFLFFFSVVHASCWIVLQSCDVCLVMRTLLLLYNVTLWYGSMFDDFCYSFDTWPFYYFNCSPCKPFCKVMVMFCSPKVAPNNFQYLISKTYILVGHYNHPISVNATIMETNLCPITGEHFVTIFIFSWHSRLSLQQ